MATPTASPATAPLSLSWHLAVAYCLDGERGLARVLGMRERRREDQPPQQPPPHIYSAEQLLETWEHIDRCTLMLQGILPDRVLLEGFWQGTVVPAIEAELQRRSRPPRQYRGGGKLAQLKALDIAEVAARYTTLRPAGPGKWKGLCPLHQEKTPSFWVYQDSGRWRCYGACATGGDVVDLLRARGDLDAELRAHGARPRNSHRPRRTTNWEVRG